MSYGSVKFYSQLIRGSEHVHSSTRDEGPCVLFVPHIEVDGHRIRTETPEERAWKERAKEVGYEQAGEFPEGTQPELTAGEGFMYLVIEHADDKSWEYLSKLPDDAYGEGSTREKFFVLVTHLEYIPLEPGDPEPWHTGPPPTDLAGALKDLERSAA